MSNDTRPRDIGSRAPALDLSRFAYDTGQADPSSSPYHQPLHSSPAFNASRRRPSAYEVSRTDRTSEHRPSNLNFGQRSDYQPVSLDQIEQEEAYARDLQHEASIAPEPAHGNRQPPARPKHDKAAAPVVQGITLISTHELPDRFRSIFPFPLFNAVQSKSFGTIYRTNDNFVLSAPTGSGKTAVLELAVCRLIHGFVNASYKIVYQAPTKSLCSERYRDWQAKFGPLDLQCAELTGDTDSAQLRNVQNATIIITTPEKWDSMTRKWKVRP